MNAELVVAVIGPGECSAEEAEVAETVGRLLAKAGVTLICEGLDGVMEAACRGCFMDGGVTVGILPGDDIGRANKYVKIPIATGMGEARNLIIVRSARSVIAIGGSHGTLSEIAFALKLGKPVIGIRTWDIEGVVSLVTPEEAVALALRQES